ncbi:MAG: hypothetical protein FWD65_01280 [Coriobacteriia bacterium]|nr:hypothetical protein [Coriobacteriia bacterium]
MKRMMTSGFLLLLAVFMALACAGCGYTARTADTTNDEGGAAVSTQQNGPVTSNSVETQIAP